MFKSSGDKRSAQQKNNDPSVLAAFITSKATITASKATITAAIIGALALLAVNIFPVVFAHQPTNAPQSNPISGSVPAGLIVNENNGQIANEHITNNYYGGSEQDVLSLPLIPDNAPTPENACDRHEVRGQADFIILLGDSAVKVGSFPHTVFTLHNEPLLVIDKDGDGSLMLKVLRIYNEQDKRVVQVTNEGHGNKPFIARDPYIRTERNDPHSLAVYDERDTRILQLRFLNPSTLSIQGRFYNHGGVFEIDENQIMIHSANSRISLGSGCSSSTGEADIGF